MTEMTLRKALMRLLESKTSTLREQVYAIQKEVEEKVEAEVKQEYLKKHLRVNLGRSSINVLKNHPLYERIQQLEKLQQQARKLLREADERFLLSTKKEAKDIFREYAKKLEELVNSSRLNKERSA
jgi:hypothetical protein